MNEVECTAMRKDIDRLIDDVSMLKQLHSALIEIKVRLDHVIDVIEGSPRFEDVGAVKRIDALEKNTISKKDVATLAGLVAAIVSAVTAMAALVIHWVWK